MIKQKCFHYLKQNLNIIPSFILKSEVLTKFLTAEVEKQRKISFLANKVRIRMTKRISKNIDMWCCTTIESLYQTH